MNRHDPYAATAAAYDLVNYAYRPAQVDAMESFVAAIGGPAASGTVLDVGAGSGLNTALLLDRCSEVSVLASEPSVSMRALAVQRVAAEPAWWPRVTVRPEPIEVLPLPERLSGVVMLGVVGHLGPQQRRDGWARLAHHLAPGAALLLDLQMPEEPQVIEPFTWPGVRLGDVTYEGSGQACPDESDPEAMRWQMTYSVRTESEVLEERTVEHVYHHPRHEVVTAELEAVGLCPQRLGDTTFWLAASPRSRGAAA